MCGERVQVGDKKCEPVAAVLRAQTPPQCTEKVADVQCARRLQPRYYMLLPPGFLFRRTHRFSIAPVLILTTSSNSSRFL